MVLPYYSFLTIHLSYLKEIAKTNKKEMSLLGRPNKGAQALPTRSVRLLEEIGSGSRRPKPSQVPGYVNKGYAGLGHINQLVW